jgi:hypothetical protein
VISRRAAVASIAALPLAAQESVVWNFDRLDQIGGHKTQIFGSPKRVKTQIGPAIEFNGVDDAIFLDVHPLAGATAFTWEVIFRPASGGRPEQRFFHLQETGSVFRYLMETRLLDGKWALDTFAASSTGSKTLLDKTLLHPLDVWHHVALVYDGKTMSHHINHKLELSAEVALAPQGAGQTSVGVRINKVDYFKGAVHKARFTKRALGKAEFLAQP